VVRVKSEPLVRTVETVVSDSRAVGSDGGNVGE
jgi:hypothetical protein